MLERYKRPVFPLVLLAIAAAPWAASGQAHYYPDRWDWERRTPNEVGFDADLLQQAVDFAIASESAAPRDLGLNHALTWGREPYDAPVGPHKIRGPQTGVIVKNGYVVAEWGEPERVDMTFSVTKSFLSTTVGLAWEQGLIRDVHDHVRDYMPLGHFETEHNRKITWDHLLRQTSDWEGTLWDKPDWADRPRGEPSTWLTRERDEPGTAYKYNDVRVNVLALAALNVWRQPLPQVLREHVMDPIGASSGWRWFGYENSWVNIDGARVQSVSGGGHWGGGMFISALDLARFGYLFLRDGRWEGTQLVPEAWIEMARTPTGPQPGYGYMNFMLNLDGVRLPAAPRTAFYFSGAGSNIVYIDQDNDIVGVFRWIRSSSLNGIVERILAADRTRVDASGRP